MKVLTNEKRQLEESLRESEERCFWHENTLQSLMTRNMELEGHIVQHKTTADDSVSTIA